MPAHNNYFCRSNFAASKVPNVLGRLIDPRTTAEAGAARRHIGLKPRSDVARQAYLLSESLELRDGPPEVWKFTLGGYPVLKNWVEYRRGRALSLDDADWPEGIVRRIQGLLHLGVALDEHYKYKCLAAE